MDTAERYFRLNCKIRKFIFEINIIITGHENTKLFITHGGLLSTQEAIYNAVPMLGIPVLVDQFLVSECSIEF